MVKWTKKTKMIFGRLLGAAKHKGKKENLAEVYDSWRALCDQNGINPTDRVLELMLWDLQQGGVDLAQVKELKRSVEMEEGFAEAKTALEIKKMAQQFAQESIKAEQEFQKTLTDQRRYYEDLIGSMLTRLEKVEKVAKEPVIVKDKRSKEEIKADMIRRKVYGYS